MATEDQPTTTTPWMLERFYSANCLGFKPFPNPQDLVGLGPDVRAGEAGLNISAFQAPVTSASKVGSLQEMIRSVPSTIQVRSTKVQEGDPAPDFQVIAPDGRTLALRDFRGNPVIIRMTRAGGTGIL
jgi:hypothetical protein